MKTLSNILKTLTIVLVLSSYMISVNASTGYHSPRLGNSEAQMTCLFYNCRNSPISDAKFREAFSYLIDRDLIVEATNETVTKLEYFIPVELDEWVDESNFLRFNITNCWIALDEAGYTIDEDSNRRIDPKTQSPMRDLILVTPTYQENPEQWLAGETIFYYATILRIPLIHATLYNDGTYAQAVRDREYDMIIMDVKVETTPTILYYLLHSQQDKQYTSAYSGIDDSQLDSQLATLLDGSLSEQKNACKNIQERLNELIPYAPIYSSSSEPETDITFVFDKVTSQTKSTGETVNIAVAFDYIEFLDAEETVISKYEMGTNDTIYGYTNFGFYNNEANLEGIANYVWAGGIYKIASITVKDVFEFSYIRMNIRPSTSNNPIHVLVDGVDVGTITPKTGWATYTLPIVEEFVPEKMPSSLSCTLSSQSIESGEEITISGALNPKLEGASVMMYIIAPSDHRDEFTLTTDSDGTYVYSFEPIDVGEWSVGVSWAGNDEYLEATSQEKTWSITEEQSTEPTEDTDQGGIPGYNIESIIISLIMTTIILSVLKKQKITYLNARA